MIPRKLTILDKNYLLSHLLSLQEEDRRLRFGGVVTDNYIENYVHASFDGESKWFGCEEDGKIVAACHAAVRDGQAELGCSVDKNYRNQKMAQAMFDRAVMWLRSKGITEVYMHCLSENGAMKHIARKNDMTVVSLYGETDANVKIEPGTSLTPVADAYLDRMAIYDTLLKKQIDLFRAMVVHPK